MEDPPLVRVLVVDDNIDATMTMGLLLEAQGYSVQTANDGPTGLALAESFSPDVILLDLGLPGMNGLEVARRLREHARTGKIPEPLLVAVTGWGRSEDREATREAGFAHHLVKPVHLSTLRELFTEHLLHRK